MLIEQTTLNRNMTIDPILQKALAELYKIMYGQPYQSAQDERLFVDAFIYERLLDRIDRAREFGVQDEYKELKRILHIYEDFTS